MSRSVPWINDRETNHDTLFKYLNLCIYSNVSFRSLDKLQRNKP